MHALCARQGSILTDEEARDNDLYRSFDGHIAIGESGSGRVGGRKKPENSKSVIRGKFIQIMSKLISRLNLQVN